MLELQRACITMHRRGLTLAAAAALMCFGRGGSQPQQRHTWLCSRCRMTTTATGRMAVGCDGVLVGTMWLLGQDGPPQGP
jgi:hypothetical protein